MIDPPGRRLLQDAADHVRHGCEVGGAGGIVPPARQPHDEHGHGDEWFGQQNLAELHLLALA